MERVLQPLKHLNNRCPNIKTYYLHDMSPSWFGEHRGTIYFKYFFKLTVFIFFQITSLTVCKNTIICCPIISGMHNIYQQIGCLYVWNKKWYLITMIYNQWNNFQHDTTQSSLIFMNNDTYSVRWFPMEFVPMFHIKLLWVSRTHVCW